MAARVDLHQTIGVPEFYPSILRRLGNRASEPDGHLIIAEFKSNDARGLVESVGDLDAIFYALTLAQMSVSAKSS